MTQHSDPADIPPGQYYLVEHCKDGLWTCLIARNRPTGQIEVVSVTAALELSDARRQAFQEIEEAAWDKPRA